MAENAAKPAPRGNSPKDIEVALRRGRMRRRWRTWSIAYVFLLPTLLIMGIFQFWPMLQAFWLSLYDVNPFDQSRSEFIKGANYAQLWGDQAFWDAAVNSILYLIVVPVIIILSLALAMLVEPHIPFINFFRACYYVPVVTMMVVVALVWKLIFDTDNGLVNQMLMKAGMLEQGHGIPWLTSKAWALWTVMSVTIWKGLGYYMVLFIVGLKAVPKELKEAARIDGAHGWQVFRHVTLPSLWPVISLTAILSSIAALQVFEEIFILTKGKLGTSTIVYQIFATGLDFESGGMDMGYACAMGVVLFALVFTFTAFSVKALEKVYDS